eukprot:TRINITY_DN112088_c0_g1_i1.p1 TRINITY_DN112088_c0_g1~~TRINITY_DN112088_c0_g1_i1.p1  ORF type:complete len:397 (+),score=107.80 TRINITY_DN112088_c0_g1_i1:163-1353(+)
MGSEASTPEEAAPAEEIKEPPTGQLDVAISVYQLNILGPGFMNSLGTFLVGAYHSAVVVAGEEWAFGGHSDELKSGVYKIPPQTDVQHVFYQRVPMGRLEATPEQIRTVVTDFALQPRWRGTAYDLLERNCNHFTSDLCWLLLRRRPPGWINGTADEMARANRRQRVFQAALDGAIEAYLADHSNRRRSSLSVGSSDDGSGSEEWDEFGQAMGNMPGAGRSTSTSACPGLEEFREEFKAVFDLVWEQRWRKGQHIVHRCQMTEDPDFLRSQLESECSAEAAASAGVAATVVGIVERAGIRSRAKQDEAGLTAWDDVWSEESARLLTLWRKQALDGELELDSTTVKSRSKQVAEAVAAAEAASKDATKAARESPACGCAHATSCCSRGAPTQRTYCG